MKKRLLTILSILFFPLLLITGFSNWVIIGSKTATVAISPSSAIAYLSNDTSTYYTSVEKALSVANSTTSNVTVYVVPGTDAYIYRDCTINSNVTLSLPYEGTTTLSRSGNSSSFADATSTNKVTEIKVMEGVTITMNGTLTIGGVLGSESVGLSGHTSGLYCQLTMGRNSKIIGNGTINCFGFIKEDKIGNDSIVDMQSGTINMPFVVYDFHGGTYTTTVYLSGGQAPFYIYDMPNIQTKLKCTSNSKIVGYVDLWASSKHNTNEMTIVAKNGSAAILNISDGGYIISKYTPASTSTTSREYSLDHSYTDIEVFGGVSTGSMQLEVSSAKVDTENVLFPVSWKYRFHLKEGTSSLNTDFKFLPGSSLKVYDGAKLNIDSEVLFFDNSWDGDQATVWYKYPDLNVDASFTVDGTCEINGSFGGEIKTSSDKNTGKLIFGSNFYSGVATTEGNNVGSTSSTGPFKFNPVNVIALQANGKFVGQSSNQYFQKGNEYSVHSGKWNGTFSSKQEMYTLLIYWTIPFNSLTKSHTFTFTYNNTTTTYTAPRTFYLLPTLSYTAKGDSELNSFTKRGNLSANEVYHETAKNCLLPGTMITMSDGTKKLVEQIQPGDMLKVFNHYTGEYDVSPVVFNESEPKQDVKVINLEFSNGSTIGVIYEHGFFDLDLMKYVYIDEYNYNDYVGHRFNSDGNNIVTLNRAYITTRYTEVYSPVTAYHLNYFTEDILSMPGGIEGLFNIFEYDDDLKYNEELMKQDIEKYGLYTYDDFKDYCSYEFYQAFPAKYLKVAVGKGYITFDEIIYLINRYKTKV